MEAFHARIASHALLFPIVLLGSSSNDSNSPFSVCAQHRPKDSRDLMVYACEKFLPYSAHFKTVQNFYHRRRLRRIAPSPRTADETLRLFISSALYHGFDLLKKSPQSLLEVRAYLPFIRLS
ncbi:hypothetical protein OSTOST_05495 [Ostertagia ostertagi]